MHAATGGRQFVVMSKSPILPVAAAILAVVVAVAAVCWWTLGRGPHPLPAVTGSSLDEMRLGKRPPGAGAGTHGSRERDDPPGTNALIDIYGGHAFQKPTKEQLEPYLKSRRRSATALLVAWQITGELEFLREAATKEPANPQVLLALATKETAPEAKSKALAALRQALPKNPLGDYLQAAAEAQAGNRDAAVATLNAAATKTGFDRLQAQFHDEAEAAYLTVGLDPLVARALAVTGDCSKIGVALFPVARLLAEFSGQAQQAGDPAGALEYAKMCVQLAERTRQDSGMLDHLVSVAMEEQVLSNLDPETVVAAGGDTAAQCLADAQALRSELRDLNSKTSQLATLSARDAYRYFDIFQNNGELAALRWFKQQLEEP